MHHRICFSVILCIFTGILSAATSADWRQPAKASWFTICLSAAIPAARTPTNYSPDSISATAGGTSDTTVIPTILCTTHSELPSTSAGTAAGAAVLMFFSNLLQYSQSDSYYQQHSTQQGQTIGTQEYPYVQQYGQQYGQQYAQQAPQQYSQSYTQAPAQSNGQLYQQTAQVPSHTWYSQQPYTDQYVQQSELQTQTAAPATNAALPLVQSQDPMQQQAYAAYYNQQVCIKLRNI
eukprot:Gb_31012 [translate_table: standard]